MLIVVGVSNERQHREIQKSLRISWNYVWALGRDGAGDVLYSLAFGKLFNDHKEPMVGAYRF